MHSGATTVRCREARPAGLRGRIKADHMAHPVLRDALRRAEGACNPESCMPVPPVPAPWDCWQPGKKMPCLRVTTEILCCA